MNRNQEIYRKYYPAKEKGGILENPRANTIS